MTILGMWTKHWIFICLNVVFIFAVSDLNAEDFVTVTSDDTVEIDKVKGTALLKGNVVITKRSDGSTLKTDKLFLLRDANTEKLMRAEADGNVDFKFNDIQEDQSVNTTRVTCNMAIFEREESLAEFKGSVRVESEDYWLEGDKLRYDYDKEKGKITEIPGKQVKMMFYKKQAKDNGKTDDVKPRQEISGKATVVSADRQLRKAILQGKVEIIDRSDLSTFKANRADVFFDINEEVEEIIANGNFSLTQPKRKSSADRAVFNYQTEIITLIGNALVKEEGQMEIKSSKIRMYMKVNKGIIQGEDNVPIQMKIPLK